MRRSDTPFLIDLFAISLRWLALFGLTLSLGQVKVISPLIIIVLVIPALWNGFMSFLAIFNTRLAWHRTINVLMDMVVSMALYFAVGRMGTEAFWVAMLPLFSSGLYFEVRGTLLVALIMALIQSGYTYLTQHNALTVASYGPIIGFNMAVGLLVALLSVPVVNRLRKSYHSTISKREESERTVQRKERGRMRALFEMIETFSSTLNYQTVLETVLDTALAALKPGMNGNGSMIGAVMLFGDRNILEIRAARGFLSSDMNIRLPADQGALYAAMKSGEAQLVTKPAKDPELSQLLSLHERRAALCLPLIRGMDAFGMLVFAHDEERFFVSDRLETLEMLGNQAVIALHNAQLYQALAREKERIVQTQEEVQRKLARDLHDGPTQSISAIAMRLNVVRKLMERSPKEAIEEVQRIEDLARRTTSEMRHMLFTLRPLVLETEGLIAALCAMADKMSELYMQNVTVEADPSVVMELDASRQTVVFYMAEEAVNNARKHARATDITVRLCSPENMDKIALLEVQDNGIGFDVQSIMGAYDRRGSLGMINMHERADLVNGLLKVESTPGKGTCVQVFIPLDEEAADRLRKNGR